MTIQVKLYVEPDNEIRRFTLENSATFSVLQQRIQQLVERENFRLFWQDSEGDQVVCGSDEEFTAARQTLKHPCEPLRIFVRRVTKTRTIEGKKLHPDVLCDGCQGPVAGTRFKCVECPDYDLCEKCHDAETHQEHDMLLVRQPNSGDWKKFFGHGRKAGRGGPCGPFPGAREVHLQSCRPRRHGPCHGPPNEPGVPSEATHRRGPPFGRPRGFMPPFLGPMMGGCPFSPRFTQTLEMNVDPNQPFPEVIAEITQKLIGEFHKAREQEAKAEQAGEEKTQEQESTAVAQDAADLLTATVVNAVSQVAEIIQQAGGEQTASDGEADWTHLQAEPVHEQAAKKDEPQQQSNQAGSAQQLDTSARDGRVEAALRAMEQMGFPTEGNLLRRLLQNYNGDISRVLDSIK